MGHDAYVLKQTLTQAASLQWPVAAAPELPSLPGMPARTVHDLLEQGGCTVVAVRASAAYRAGHIPAAVLPIPPRLPAQLQGSHPPTAFVAKTTVVAPTAP